MGLDAANSVPLRKFEPPMPCHLGLGYPQCSRAFVEENSKIFDEYLQVKLRDPVKFVTEIGRGKFWPNIKNNTDMFLHNALLKVLAGKWYILSDAFHKNLNILKTIKTDILLLFAEYLKTEAKKPGEGGDLLYLVEREVLRRFIRNKKNRKWLERITKFLSGAKVEVREINHNAFETLLNFGVFFAKLKITSKDKSVIIGKPNHIQGVRETAPLQTQIVEYKGKKHFISAEAIKHIVHWYAWNYHPSRSAGQFTLPEYKIKDMASCALDVLWARTERKKAKCDREGRCYVHRNIFSLSKFWNP